MDVGRGAVNAAWSRDGRRLAFAGDGIYVVRADGSGKRRLTTLPPESERYPESSDFSPSWYPDGKRILFQRELIDTRVSDDFQVDLFTVATSGGRPVRLTRTPGIWEHDPAVSPDGRTIAFSLSDQRSRQTPIADGLFLLDSNGTRLRRLTSGVADSPSWSPDSKRIAFVRERSTATGGSATEIYIINADRTGLRRLTRRSRDYSPVWSPDGRWIAFCRFSGEAGRPPRQYLVSPGGGKPRALSLGPPGCVTDWQARPSR